ncbi:Hpt domain-containing protein [Yersinia enterocolitica]|jgi:HPt (histidine-containing phosphotransfer) domain-containing protein|uniref:HPt domain-containing protein n=2 Tax=Yersinia TaxID=629 RepID=A0AAI8ZPY9_YERFR|nr:MULTISPECIES: Hpt domain-containing protein [Yersinia]ATM88334.1 Hpt domain-containing protein [Yersinia frederiksenii]AVX39896.1 Hpt domain-containing protein [Yersinia massiliensis]MCB5317010.1 Hpt domain-containing protein [Yersinia massiliensis]MDN0126135.1 Hpt domain-containing protein [Yersinia massiliensis]QKJ10625.1 Hpt domain-containing protein [Yersinia massiliensis]
MSDPTFSARYRASVRDYLCRIEEIAKTGDLAAVQKIGHKMLGLCQLFGTPEQVYLCEQLENASDLVTLKETVSQFHAQIDHA